MAQGTKLVPELLTTNTYRAIRCAREAAAEFDESVLRKKLDHTLLKEVAPARVWELVEKIIAGKLQSQKAAINPY